MSPSAAVVHVGPDPAFPGGIATVMSALVEHSVGGPGTVLASWVPGSRWLRLRVLAAAAVHVVRLPSTTLVHVHMAADGSVARKGLLLGLARLTRHSTVVTVHASRFEAFVAKRPRVTAAALRSAGVVLVLSPKMETIVQQLLPSADVRPIYNPIDHDPSPTDAGLRPPLAVFAGEVGTRKGADVLAEAWPLVRAAVPDARLRVVGPTTEFQFPELAGVTVEGPVNRDDVRGLVREARVTVLPSRAEALPMVLLESLASATPIVATDVGDVKRLTQTGGGRLVAIGDAAALADALIGYLSDADAATASGRAGHALCAAEFGLDGLSQATREAYATARQRAAKNRG
ncbi:MAG: glycosyltransferase [Solirubrobacteraceae bacterium]|nr:glycosyltransferase [Solirubrobacteraceae bacterium]